MASPKKNNPAEDLMEALLKEVGGSSHDDAVALDSDQASDSSEVDLEPLNLNSTYNDPKPSKKKSKSSASDNTFNTKTENEYERTRIDAVVNDEYQDENSNENEKELNLSAADEKPSESLFGPSISSQKPSDSLFGPSEPAIEVKAPVVHATANHSQPEPTEILNSSDATVALNNNNNTVRLVTHDQATVAQKKPAANPNYNEQERTVAVTAFQMREVENHDDKVKVSIGQNRSAYSPGYASWGGGSEASLGQAENLRIAQEKILDLEKENEKLRLQNEELMSASDIIKERSDLLTAQVNEYKNDKEGLEESFKNEIALLKAHLNRKEVEVQKSQIKIDDLDSRLKFDMKKIRIRERELENRLELIRAEKNALLKSKDEQILDLRRKMDVLQMEVDSYRQKCIDLNKNLEVNQDSFKRTTRALRLAMANLELQEENKVSLKKVD